MKTTKAKRQRIIPIAQRTVRNADMYGALGPLREELAIVLQRVNEQSAELHAAVARKPSQVLLDLVYQLKAVRQELAQVEEQLRRNTDVLERFLKVPVAQPLSAHEHRA